MASAYADALRMLAGRELSAAEVRARLLDRQHAAEDIAQAIEQLQQDGSLDDGRVARAYARTAVDVKGRGRLRIARELHEKGIDKEIISTALAEVFGEVDERSLVRRAIEKKLRGRPRPTGAADHARLYQYLMRQGFSPASVSAELRQFRPHGPDDD